MAFGCAVDSRKSVALVWLAKQHIFDNPMDRRICYKDEVGNGTVPVGVSKRED